MSIMKATIICATLCLFSVLCAWASEGPNVAIRDWQAVEGLSWLNSQDRCIYVEVVKNNPEIQSPGYAIVKDPIGWSKKMSQNETQRFLKSGTIDLTNASGFLFPMPVESTIHSAMFLPFVRFEDAENNEATRIKWTYRRNASDNTHMANDAKIERVRLQQISIIKPKTIRYGRNPGAVALVYRDPNGGHVVASSRIVMSSLPGVVDLWVHPGYKVSIMINHEVEIHKKTHIIRPSVFYETKRIYVEASGEKDLALNLAPKYNVKLRKVAFQINEEMLVFKKGQYITFEGKKVNKVFTHRGPSKFRSEGSWVNLGFIEIVGTTSVLSLPLQFEGTLPYGLRIPPVNIIGTKDRVIDGISIHGHKGFVKAYKFERAISASELHRETDKKLIIQLKDDQ